MSGKICNLERNNDIYFYFYFLDSDQAKFGFLPSIHQTERVVRKDTVGLFPNNLEKETTRDVLIYGQHGPGCS